MATATQSFAIFTAAIYIWYLPLSYALVCAFNTFEIKRGYSKHNMYKTYAIQLQLRLYRVHTIITITAVITVLLCGLCSSEELRVFIVHFICCPHVLQYPLYVGVSLVVFIYMVNALCISLSIKLVLN